MLYVIRKINLGKFVYKTLHNLSPPVESRFFERHIIQYGAIYFVIFSMYTTAIACIYTHIIICNMYFLTYTRMRECCIARTRNSCICNLCHTTHPCSLWWTRQCADLLHGACLLNCHEWSYLSILCHHILTYVCCW